MVIDKDDLSKIKFFVGRAVLNCRAIQCESPKEAIMKRALSLAALLLIAVQLSAADSVKIFNNISANLFISPNDGSGGNMGFSLSGRGISLNGNGGTGCDWCFAGTSFAPGQSLNASIFFVGFDFVANGQIGSTHFGPGDISLGSSSITAGSFVFPKMRNVFTVSVPAAFDSTLFGGVIESGQAFGLNIRPGMLKLTFDFSAACGGASGCYFFDRANFTSTPEPSTVLLSVTGLMFIAGRAWRKRNPL